MSHGACPYRTRLRDLLFTGTGGDDDALVQHLTECATCQRYVEQVTGKNGAWSARAQTLDMDATESEPPLRDVIAIARDLTRLLAERPQVNFDERLLRSFLSPAEQSRHLGRLGSYLITHVIGRGGMGVVLHALDPSLNRVVATKVLAPHLASSEAGRLRFAREARAAAAVSHDHVVAIHAVDEANGLPYLVMQYIPGISLQERLDRDGPLLVPDILRIGMQTASGLAAAHAQGLVHRD